METGLPHYPALDEEWKQHAACKGMDTNLFFPTQGDSHTLRHAKAVCDRCTVAEECLRYCVDSGIRFGVWGGTSERWRRVELDRRQAKVRVHATHGTNGGYARHLREGTEPCDECRMAHRLYQQRTRGSRAHHEDGAA